MLGSGTHLLGHGFFNDQIKELVDDGVLYGDSSLNEFRLKNSLQDIFGEDNEVLFCNSGSEANLKAIRACRAFTGKDKVAMFSGSWHGSYEPLLFQEDWSVPRWPPTYKTLGYKFHIPLPVTTASNGVKNHDEIDVYPYNMDFSLHYLNTKIDNYSAVIIEPIQGSNPREDMKDFLVELRRITSEANVPLIFDEVITGFRVGLKGVQGWYDIVPDISVYGKIIGGGFPFGVVVGDPNILNTKGVYYGGTFSGNPFSCGVGNLVLDFLKNHLDLYTELYEITKDITDEIKKEIENYPVQILKCHSFFRFVFSESVIKERRDREESEDYSLFLEFRNLLKQKSVVVGKNGLFFICYEHSKHKNKYIDQIVESIEGVCRE